MAHTIGRDEFQVLQAIATGGPGAQRAGVLSEAARETLRDLKAAGLVTDGGDLAEAGRRALEPYRVRNAVILAAGVGSRLSPLSHERPKALFQVRGEVLVERLIRQLHEAGIRDVTVVVGYMKEALFYLEDAFGVRLVVNAEYADRNNHSSLWAARAHLGNTYVLSADQYYTENVFEPYQFATCCSAVYSEEPTGEEVLEVDAHGRVTGLRQGGSQACFMQGPAYLDQAFAHDYLDFLARDYDLPETAGMLWEQEFAKHADALRMEVRVLKPGVIYEFDRLTDLTAFDADFLANVDSRILDDICETLGCTRDQIADVEPVKAGLTNLSTLFRVGEWKYIYRHPGAGTNEIMNREAEMRALHVAADLGLDDTLVRMDAQRGWKISRYVEGCGPLDYRDRGQVARALQMARTLHTSGRTSPWSFDFHHEGRKIVALLQDMGYPLPPDFDEMAAQAAFLAGCMAREAGEPVMCHNDFYAPNFLVRGDEMRLIDWEYAAMGDPACDIGNFVAQGSGYSVDETLDVLPLYFGRAPTPAESRHCLAAVAVVGWYWYVWAIYKQAVGNPVGEWLYVWYRAAKRYAAASLPLYQAEEP